MFWPNICLFYFTKRPPGPGSLCCGGSGPPAPLTAASGRTCRRGVPGRARGRRGGRCREERPVREAPGRADLLSGTGAAGAPGGHTERPGAGAGREAAARRFCCSPVKLWAVQVRCHCPICLTWKLLCGQARRALPALREGGGGTLRAGSGARPGGAVDGSGGALRGAGRSGETRRRAGRSGPRRRLWGVGLGPGRAARPPWARRDGVTGRVGAGSRVCVASLSGIFRRKSAGRTRFLEKFRWRRGRGRGSSPRGRSPAWARPALPARQRRRGPGVASSRFRLRVSLGAAGASILPSPSYVSVSAHKSASSLGTSPSP